MNREKRNYLLPIISAGLFLFGFQAGGFQLIIIDVAEEFTLTHTLMGSMISMQFTAIFLCPLIFAHASDTIGKKKMLLIFSPVTMIGCAILVFSHNVGFFIVGIVLIGAAYSAIESFGAAAVSDNDPAKAERRISITQGFQSAGAVTAPLIVSFLMHRGADWRIVYVIMGIGFLCLYPFLCKTGFQSEDADRSNETTESRFTDQQDKSNSMIGIMIKAFKNKALIFLLAIVVLYSFIEVGLPFFIESFYKVELTEVEIGAFAISFFWLAMTFSRVAFGVIKADPKKILSISIAVCTVALILMTVSQNTLETLILCAVIGAAFGPVWPMLLGMATKLNQERSGSLSALLMSSAGIGGAISPVVLGLFADFKGLRWSIGCLVIIGVITLCLSIHYLRRYKEVNTKRPFP